MWPLKGWIFENEGYYLELIWWNYTIKWNELIVMGVVWSKTSKEWRYRFACSLAGKHFPAWWQERWSAQAESSVTREANSTDTVKLMGRRQNLWSRTESLRWFTGRKECWKVSRGKEQSGWGVNVEPVNILQGTRICVEVAWSHQYLGRGSPHCIGLRRPHSWGSWWLQTIIYNEIWKSARRHIFSFTPFTL